MLVKCKLMRINARSDQKLKVNNENLEDVDYYVYLGSKIKSSEGGSEDTTHGLTKAWASFKKLSKIWYQRNAQSRIKILLYNCW